MTANGSKMNLLLTKLHRPALPTKRVHRTGIVLANSLIGRARQGQYGVVTLEALLLRAQMYTARGCASDLIASQEDYIGALELAKPEGFMAVFIEQGVPVATAIKNLVKQSRIPPSRYIEHLLAAIPSAPTSDTAQKAAQTDTSPTVLVEPLADREHEVLHLIAEGLKYKEIAARLFISLNTVRSHVKAIYGKLHVNNRTQAVKKARQLHML